MRVRSTGICRRDGIGHAEARARSPQHARTAGRDPGEVTTRLTPDQPFSTWATEGPVQAEVFVLRMARGSVELAGPCGPEPWYLEVGEEEDPVDVVNRFSTNLMGEPLLVHSTSWRRHRHSVILSFVVILAGGQAPEHRGVPIGRTGLARSGAHAAPASISAIQVIEHGLRHLAWLVEDDETVRGVLSDEWRSTLAGYVPEPFRHLG